MSPTRNKPSSLLDTRVIYCGDNLDQLAKLMPSSAGNIGSSCRSRLEKFWTRRSRRSWSEAAARIGTKVKGKGQACPSQMRLLCAQRRIPHPPPGRVRNDIVLVACRTEFVTAGAEAPIFVGS